MQLWSMTTCTFIRPSRGQSVEHANQRGLANVRLAVIGAFEFLEQYAAPQTIQEIPLYYPQPYKDSERAYKRLITPEFLPLVHR